MLKHNVTTTYESVKDNNYYFFPFPVQHTLIDLHTKFKCLQFQKKRLYNSILLNKFVNIKFWFAVNLICIYYMQLKIHYFFVPTISLILNWSLKMDKWET